MNAAVKQSDLARLQDCADRMLADADSAIPERDYMILAMQNALGYLYGVHQDRTGATEHLQMALDKAGSPYQSEDAV